MGTIYTDPPIWLSAVITNIDNNNLQINQWNITLQLLNPQFFGGNGDRYDGTTVTAGMWIANRYQGFAWKIISISYQEILTINCIVEDVNNWNLNSDPYGYGDGSPDINTYTYIFQLQANGLPAITSVTNAQINNGTDTWTDNLLGRFIPNLTSNSSGPTGPTGPTGPSGSKYYSEFTYNFFQAPLENGTTNDIFIGSGLSYSGNESVIVTNLSDSNTHFEAIIDSYNASTGNANIKMYTNIFGTSYSGEYLYSINLTGQRGSKWYSYPTGPAGINNNIGRPGDFFIDENTGYVYVRIS